MVKFSNCLGRSSFSVVRSLTNPQKVPVHKFESDGMQMGVVKGIDMKEGGDYYVMVEAED